MSHDQYVKLILDFLSDTKWIILTVVILILFRKQVRNVLDRCTGFKINGMGTSFEIDTSNTDNNKAQDIDKSLANDKSDEAIKDELKTEITQSEKYWIEELNEKLEDKDLQGAKDIFSKQRIKEPNISEFDIGFYYYRIYSSGLDNGALHELKNKIDTASEDESKLELSMWYSLCFNLTKNYKKSIESYFELLNSVDKEASKTNILIQIAKLQIENNETDKAKKIIIERINIVNNDDELSSLYIALADIEKKLNNIRLSVFCRDKSLDYSPINRDIMFSSAFDANKENIEFIEICNYNNLIRIDEKDSSSLNNIAVCIEKFKLKTISTKNYLKSSELKNSLATTNLGFIYLKAGLTDIAKELAEKAIKIKPPHPNAYTLLTDINEIIEKENNEWEKIKENSYFLQKKSRNYTQAYYQKNNIYFTKMPEDWSINGLDAKFSVIDNKLNIAWLDSTISPAKKIKISAKIVNNSFSGTYTENTEVSSTPLFSSGNNKNIKIIGFYNKEDDSLEVFAEDMKNVFILNITKK
ncbi:Uncharacterised protein [Yersinia intermedia]|uniref:tetratricopeptide repeat protein n=1 Tax=Yersinia intermedia TaxID=631 RepID=UPI0005E4A1A9|nr:hypothetical protein [Yersinia intermedia]CNC87226.1 Uncharacterised protein [Yersinia intermedia]CNH04593.1 Uncharacterised protein [Yersinia intermedia]